ncbi:flagellar basal body rod protein FlgC [Pseudomonadales bacterium]|jgi:flagellar basal-body rod protein FlgC|nr:flagellar basal body rod protein FlgC [Gammaproteobacteria bacterium]MDA7774580.1 flagellar basal body rod protein FlgC [Pseudomonadales bacterium]MDB3989077.1 flagellar basal body rod protein FlgC [Pseudomonadales bacterium]MDC0894489.1 flagellar basal body rod protein FlgC [Pseudomonadales bacterium]MDC1084490.1 flagellar basal body rod protein FlgC [Pseudomonadales bacterium]|tara:strand:+ start:375 stop:800 length:426 start_codon:yes stop_codon:yes gene_type:complete
MSFENIMGIAGQAMDAQTIRINAAVSNIANADTQAGSPDDAFKAKRVVFKSILASEVNQDRGDPVGGVRVTEIAEDNKPAPAIYKPNHPDADEDGYIYTSNVDVMTEMVDITAASRSYESVVEASNTAKRLMMRTIELLKK